MNQKDMLVEQIGRKSRRKAAKLAGEFARADSQDKEEILAELDFEQWLAQCCDECLEGIETLK